MQEGNRRSVHVQHMCVTCMDSVLRIGDDVPADDAKPCVTSSSLLWLRTTEGQHAIELWAEIDTVPSRADAAKLGNPWCHEPCAMPAPLCRSQWPRRGVCVCRAGESRVPHPHARTESCCPCRVRSVCRPANAGHPSDFDSTVSDNIMRTLRVEYARLAVDRGLHGGRSFHLGGSGSAGTEIWEARLSRTSGNSKNSGGASCALSYGAALLDWITEIVDVQ